MTPARNCYCGGPEEIYPHQHGTGHYCRQAQQHAQPAVTDDEYIRRVLALFAGETSECLTWTGNGTTQPFRFDAWINDVFFWGAADHEPITPDTLTDLEAAFAEARAIDPEEDYQAVVLWCARRRGTRPQGAHYKNLPEALVALLDACGPHRPTGLGNPIPHPDPGSTP